MAKFDILYPDINAYCFEINDLIKTNKMRTCCVCEEKTNYIHLGHAAPVCSEECLKELEMEMPFLSLWNRQQERCIK